MCFYYVYGNRRNTVIGEKQQQQQKKFPRIANQQTGKQKT